VRAILDLSRTFGLQVVAEGVETPAHCRELIRLGCRYPQGYAIARPMPAAAVPEWTRQWREQLPAWIGPDRP
jgi:EAL domain-containing protein (putative c-di-GMP-specific phosphodiesterase class I)